MKDFDVERGAREQRERVFKLAGREFHRRAAVAPESILEWSKASTGESAPNEEQWLVILDNTVLAMLEPGQEEAWREIRRPDLAHPVALYDLTELVQWLFEEMSGRPTSQPSDSSTGSDGPTTTASSTAESSSPVAPASAA